MYTTHASTCYYARARLLFKNMLPGQLQLCVLYCWGVLFMRGRHSLGLGFDLPNNDHITDIAANGDLNKDDME